MPPDPPSVACLDAYAYMHLCTDPLLKILASQSENATVIAGYTFALRSDYSSYAHGSRENTGKNWRLI